MLSFRDSRLHSAALYSGTDFEAQFDVGVGSVVPHILVIVIVRAPLDLSALVPGLEDVRRRAELVQDLVCDLVALVGAEKTLTSTLRALTDGTVSPYGNQSHLL